MILVDSNVPMYLIGAAHPNKVRAQFLIEKLMTEHRRLVTDAEVLQEILHRFVSINRRDAIQPAFDALLEVVDQVFAIDKDVVNTAKQVVLGYSKLSARDGVHVAVMRRNEITEILSFDSGFDAVPGITRLA